MRYKRLLPADDIYTKENLRALSSSRQRCLASVESLLAALLPPNQRENPLPIPWQPVAAKPLPADTDYVSLFICKIPLKFKIEKKKNGFVSRQMLYQGKAPCPKYDRIYNKFLSDPDPQTDFYKYNKNLLNLYVYLTEHSGAVSIDSAIHKIPEHEF